MAVIVSIDLGTTKITSLTLETDRGTILARGTALNDANVTPESDRAGPFGMGCRPHRRTRLPVPGRRCATARRTTIRGSGNRYHGTTAWHGRGRRPLAAPHAPHQLAGQAGARPDAGRRPNVSRRRGERLGEKAATRTGCRLHPGFSGLTLFWMKENGRLPAGGRACFIMDLFGGILAAVPPVTEPLCVGSSGLFNVRTRSWDSEAIAALGLPPSLFPEVREADQPVGPLAPAMAEKTGLPAGTPVFSPIGDHQAGFLGSLRDLHQDVLVNVGTGAQVAVYTEGWRFAAPVELRPLPLRHNLLSNVGLAGGWSYQILENFFRRISTDVFGLESDKPAYETLNRLAASVPPGCDGLVCDPHFSGSRADPTQRGAFAGVTPQNMTPGHFARAVLEGMARSLADGLRYMAVSENRPHGRIVAAGNALCENAVLRDSVRDAFELPLCFTRHREEAAFGAAPTAAVGAGLFSSLEDAARLIEYE